MIERAGGPYFSDFLSHEEFVAYMATGLPELTPEEAAESERESREICGWLVEKAREAKADRERGTQQ